MGLAVLMLRVETAGWRFGNPSRIMPSVPLGPFSLSVAPYPPRLIWLVKINLILPFLGGPRTSVWEMLSYLLGLGDSFVLKNLSPTDYHSGLIPILLCWVKVVFQCVTILLYPNSTKRIPLNLGDGTISKGDSGTFLYLVMFSLFSKKWLRAMATDFRISVEQKQLLHSTGSQEGGFEFPVRLIFSLIMSFGV